MNSVKKIADRIVQRFPHVFDIRDWRGRLIRCGDNPKFTITFKDSRTFKEVFLKADLYAAGKAYIEKRLCIEGDIFEAIRIADHIAGLKLNMRERRRLLGDLLMI